MTKVFDYISAYIPFYCSVHKKNWINDKFNKLKLKYGYDDKNDIIKINKSEFSSYVIEHYIFLAYNDIFYGMDYGHGLRMDPIRLINLV